MNLKKILQAQAEKDALALLTEDDEKFIQQLVQNGTYKQPRTRVKADRRHKKVDKGSR